MVKGSPGVNPKPRFGPILDSTAPASDFFASASPFTGARLQRRAGAGAGAHRAAGHARPDGQRHGKASPARAWRTRIWVRYTVG